MYAFHSSWAWTHEPKYLTISDHAGRTVFLKLPGRLTAADLPFPVKEVLASAHTLIGMDLEETACLLAGFGFWYARYVTIHDMIDKYPNAAPGQWRPRHRPSVQFTLAEIGNTVWYHTFADADYGKTKVLGCLD